MNIRINAGLISVEKKLLSKGIELIDSVIFFVGSETDSQIWTIDKKLNNSLSPNLRYHPNDPDDGI